MNTIVKSIFKLIGVILFFCIVKNVLLFIFDNRVDWIIDNDHYWIFVGFGLIPAFIAEIKGHSFFLFWIRGAFNPISSTISILGLDDNSEQKNDPSLIEPVMVCFKGKITNYYDESIEGAKISVKRNELSCVSDTCGNFSITIPSTESTGMSYWIEITKEGYESFLYLYIATQGNFYNFKLKSISE